MKIKCPWCGESYGGLRQWLQDLGDDTSGDWDEVCDACGGGYALCIGVRVEVERCMPEPDGMEDEE